ncbi:MAG: hypothetical protein ACYTFI_00240 [Planctomycetota bacterium]
MSLTRKPVTTDEPCEADGAERPKKPASGRPGALPSRVLPMLGAPGGYALAALYAVTALLAVALVVAMAGAVARAVSGGPKVPDAIRSQFRWREAPEIRLKKARPAGEARPEAPGALSGTDTSAANGQGVGASVVRWREEEKLRRAAAILLIDEDYEGAMELLLQVRGEDSRAFALDRAAHRKILAHLRSELLHEREALRAFLGGLPEAERSQLLGLDEKGGRGDLEKLLALPPHEFHLPQCAAALPEKVALCFVRNVHVRLARATGANDTLLALVLGLGFRQGSDAARVYWEDFPKDFFSYDEVLPASSGLRERRPPGPRPASGTGSTLREGRHGEDRTTP